MKLKLELQVSLLVSTKNVERGVEPLSGPYLVS